MPATARRHESALVGSERSRIGPPTPARSLVKEFEQAAVDIDLKLLPWQRHAGRYLYALGQHDRWLYPEVAIVVARQNGKTKLLKPHIMKRLAMGRRILHAAQTRELPRLLFNELAPLVEHVYGFKAKVRRGAGQETIEIEGGGFYKIVAASGGAPRGLTIDDVLLDELRELEPDFVQAVVPTTMASDNRQIVYLSNAGTETTTALNTVRLRGDSDPSLAYLEWSASPDRSSDDRIGWAEANPAVGHFSWLEETLERLHRSHSLGGTMAAFETENLCRWVPTLREKFVDDFAWLSCKSADLGKPLRPAFAVSMDPDGTRADVIMAWRTPAEEIAITSVLHEEGENIDTDAIAEKVRELSARHGAEVGYDPLTDGDLVKHVRKGKAISINGAKYADASFRFANAVAGGRVRWSAADAVTDDLTWTSRKPDGEQGSYHAVRANDDRPITAALAAVRALFLASLRRNPEAPRIR